MREREGGGERVLSVTWRRLRRFVKLGRLRFRLDAAVGRPYGSLFEVEGNDLVPIPFPVAEDEPSLEEGQAYPTPCPMLHTLPPVLPHLP